MSDIIFECSVNLLQSFMFVGFLYFFLDRKFSKQRSIIIAIIFIAVLFALLSYFTFNPTFFTMADVILGVIICEVFTLFFTNGNIVTRIVMPIISFLINTIVSYLFVFLVSVFTTVTFEKIAMTSSLYRYICVILINLTNLVVFLILLKINSKNYNIKSIPHALVFIGVPILSMSIIYMATYILILTDYQYNLIPYLITICVEMIAIAAIVWYMFSKISKDNNLKTQLLLTKLRADMYEKNIISASTQIEEISKIKHDIKNNIACIDGFVLNNDCEKAHQVCNEILGKMQNVYTPINTNNPTLNAIINVELEKAKSNGIDFRVEILNQMLDYKNNTDLISLIGNLCDNAIEYLSNCPKDSRKMELTITKHNSFSIISCQNYIKNSIIEKNPELHSSKSDKISHGKGMLIVKEIAQKYNGDMNYKEQDNNFIVTIIIDAPNLPENS